MTYADSMVSLNEIEADRHVDVLMTRISFRPGVPNGVSLALVLRTKYPELKVVFAARAERKRYTDGIGVLIPHPVDLDRLIAAVVG